MIPIEEVLTLGFVKVFANENYEDAVRKSKDYKITVRYHLGASLEVLKMIVPTTTPYNWTIEKLYGDNDDEDDDDRQGITLHRSPETIEELIVLLTAFGFKLPHYGLTVYKYTF